jgi:hypothetical protein
MNQSCTCGCCEGVEILTPLPTANRPGLPALLYRVGTHATFLETMKARLSSLSLGPNLYPLSKLTTRDPADPAIALLDSWSVVADVLTFYQERLANEGYLRTATERRSILELARLIGYTLRPGVAASVYLAYTLDEDRSSPTPKPTTTTIPKGSRVQSVPGPGELPQSFETSDDLEARSQWNSLQVRLTRPQTERTIKNVNRPDPSRAAQPRIYLKGISTNLKENDPLLIDFGNGADPGPYRVIEVLPDAAADRTLVNLREWASASADLRVELGPLKAMIEAHLKTAAPLAKKFPAVIDPAVKSLSELNKLVDLRAPTADLGAHLENNLAPLLEAPLPASLTAPQKKKVAAWLKSVGESAALANQEMAGLAAHSAAATAPGKTGTTRVEALYQSLIVPPSQPPANSAQLSRDVGMALGRKSGAGLQLLSTLKPELAETLPSALANVQLTSESGIRAYALRVRATPFGSTALKRSRVDMESGEPIVIGEWPILEWDLNENDVPKSLEPLEREQVIYLDASYDKIVPHSASTPSWIIVDTTAWQMPEGDPSPQVTPFAGKSFFVSTVTSAQADITRAEYGLSAKTTRIQLPDKWLTIQAIEQPSAETPNVLAGIVQPIYDLDFRVIRSAAIYTQSEELDLAEEPILDPVCDGQTEPIELAGVYDGMQSGRWLVISGERADIAGISNVKASELVMVAGVVNRLRKSKLRLNSKHRSSLPGDKVHTFLQLSDKLAYCYKRETLTIYGNVVNATHGETRNEPASGDARQAFQEFALKQAPLTHVSAANPSGAESTLQLRVNDVLWHETDTLAGLEPTDRRFISRTDDENKTTAITGDGRHGARLPTGQQNVTLTYRNGIGKPGNVKARQISLLVSRPLNVKEVINPLAASGGADRESRDLARVNAPLAVMALDRLVSTSDYADFARTFAGIGKASAVELSDGRRQVVHVTIAGADDIPILESSDLYRNLRKALHELGDAYLPIQLVTRQLLLLVLQAGVRVLPDYLWEKVEPKIRAALLDKFSFQRRDLGQDALPSEVFSVIQAVEGVAYVDVDAFDALKEEQIIAAVATNTSLASLVQLRRRVRVSLAEVIPDATDPENRIAPAQLAYFTPAVPDTIILNEVKP